MCMCLLKLIVMHNKAGLCAYSFSNVSSCTISHTLLIKHFLMHNKFDLCAHTFSKTLSYTIGQQAMCNEWSAGQSSGQTLTSASSFRFRLIGTALPSFVPFARLCSRCFCGFSCCFCSFPFFVGGETSLASFLVTASAVGEAFDGCAASACSFGFWLCVKEKSCLFAASIFTGDICTMRSFFSSGQHLANHARVHSMLGAFHLPQSAL